MSYSEALSARLVPRWEPVSRNQLLVVLLFCFFIHQWRKVLRKIAAKTFVWPSWRLWSIIFLSGGLSFMFLSSVCSQGSCNHGDKCCYSHDPERTKEEKMEWFHQLFYFFLKIFLFVDFDWPSAAWMKWEWRCSQIAFQREQKPWQLLIYRTLFSFIPELLFFCLFQSNKVVTPTLLALFRSTFNVSSRQFWDVHYKLLKYSGWITQNCI